MVVILMITKLKSKAFGFPFEDWKDLLPKKSSIVIWIIILIINLQL